MKKGILILIGLLIATSFTSCKKEEVKEPTKQELLQAHVWKGVDAVEYTNGAETDRQPMTTYEFLFAVNMDYFIYNNGDVTSYGDWAYTTGNPDKLTLTDHSNPRPSTSNVFNVNAFRAASTPMVFDVDKLTADKFTFSYINPSDPTKKIVYNFKK